MWNDRWGTDPEKISTLTLDRIPLPCRADGCDEFPDLCHAVFAAGDRRFFGGRPRLRLSAAIGSFARSGHRTIGNAHGNYRRGRLDSGSVEGRKDAQRDTTRKRHGHRSLVQQRAGSCILRSFLNATGNRYPGSLALLPGKRFPTVAGTAARTRCTGRRGCGDRAATGRPARIGVERAGGRTQDGAGC